MVSIRQYFWPKAALLFYIRNETIEAAFGFFEKGRFVRQERREFSLEHKERFLRWHDETVKTYPSTYVAAMPETVNQGALPGCGQRTFQRFEVDMSLVRAVCVDNAWSPYISLVEMKWFEQNFKGVRFDLLFSPFVLIYEEAAAAAKEAVTVAVLHLQGLAFLAILNKERLCYADILVIEERAAVESEGDLVSDEVEELAFDLEMLDEEDGDVPTIGDGDEKGEEGFKEGDTGDAGGDEEALAMLEYNLSFFDAVKGSIEKFYRDDRYPRLFVEKALLLDLGKSGDDFVRFMEDELFMQAAAKVFDPLETMGRLAAREVGA